MIGVFDSGHGGLTVLHALTQRLPGEAFTYLGDHVSVGTKTAPVWAADLVIPSPAPNTSTTASSTSKLMASRSRQRIAARISAGSTSGASTCTIW